MESIFVFVVVVVVVCWGVVIFSVERGIVVVWSLFTFSTALGLPVGTGRGSDTKLFADVNGL